GAPGDDLDWNGGLGRGGAAPAGAPQTAASPPQARGSQDTPPRPGRGGVRASPIFRGRAANHFRNGDRGWCDHRPRRRGSPGRPDPPPIDAPFSGTGLPPKQRLKTSIPTGAWQDNAPEPPATECPSTTPERIQKPCQAARVLIVRLARRS